MRLKDLKFTDSRFDLYLSTSPSARMQGRLRGMLSAPGMVDNTKPNDFVAKLRTQGVDARIEEMTNACGECDAFCYWNNCFSMPNDEVQDVINTIHRVTIQLYGLCPEVELTVKAQGKTYTFSYQKGERLQYFNFDGISKDIADRLRAVPDCTLELYQHKGKDVTAVLYLNPGTNLTHLVEAACLAIS